MLMSKVISPEQDATSTRVPFLSAVGGASAAEESPGEPRLTTAESLIVEIVVAQHLLEAPHTVLSNSHWVRPQLDSLAYRGLIAWEFDDEANFRIVPRAAILDLPESVAIRRRLQDPTAG